MIEYQTTRDASIESLLPHWTRVFGVPADVFSPVWHAMGRDRRLVHEARADGRIVSTVAVYDFVVSLGEGCTTQMEGVANVATLEEFRGQGISGTLLKMAVAEMRGGYSLLFTGVPPHYEKVGYKLIPGGVFDFIPTGPATPPSISVDRERVEAIHRASVMEHRGAAVRDAAWWKEVTWFRTASRLVWAGKDAYLFAERHGDRFSIIEAFGAPTELAGLVNGAGTWAKSNGATRMTSQVALPPQVRATGKEHIEGAMAKSLDMSWPDVQLATATFGQGFLGIDHF